MNSEPLRTDETSAAPDQVATINQDYASRYGFHDPEDYFLKAPKGISHEVVEMISRKKGEADWMREIRHRALVS